MSNITNTLNDIRYLDQLCEKKSVIHHMHPLAKLFATGAFIVTVVSFNKYDINGLIPFFLYTLVVFILSDTPLRPLAKSVLLALPIILGVGLFNPLLDHQIIFTIGGLSISGGWISFFSLLIKGLLTVSAALLLIATTGMNDIALALRLIKVPKVFVVQLLLTYRYITVLLEEISRTMMAYGLRSPQRKGVRFKDMGPLLGQLLNRTVDRATRIYTSMCCRGFEGNYKSNRPLKLKGRDALYILGWSIFFAGMRFYNVANIMGSVITEVLK